VAGFVFGLVFAAGVKQFRFEERFVDAAIEAKAIQHENLDLEAALEARSKGQLDASEAKLLDLLKKTPGDFDVAMAYWDVRRDIGDVTPAFPHVQRVFWNALRRGDLDVVDMRWPEVLEMAPGGAVDPAMAIRVVETLGESLPESLLRETVEAGAAGVGPSTPGGVLVRLTRVAMTVGAVSARSLAEKALASSEVPGEARSEIEALLADLPEAVVEEAQPPDPHEIPAPGGDLDQSMDQEASPFLSPAPVEHQLEIMEATATVWDFGILTISVGGQERPMNLSQVQAIAVGGIVEPDRTPYIIIDLMIDGPWSKRVKLRVVRLRSTAFDPSALVEGADPMSCFRTLLKEMVDVSGAAPLPDPDSAVGKPFKRFASVREYEQEVIGLTS
jgi:hypothetical protein